MEPKSIGVVGTLGSVRIACALLGKLFTLLLDQGTSSHTFSNED